MTDTTIDDGYGYFPDWSNMMLREFDDRLQPDLARYFEIAEDVAKMARGQWTASIRTALADNRHT